MRRVVGDGIARMLGPYWMEESTRGREEETKVRGARRRMVWEWLSRGDGNGSSAAELML